VGAVWGACFAGPLLPSPSCCSCSLLAVVHLSVYGRPRFVAQCGLSFLRFACFLFSCKWRPDCGPRRVVEGPSCGATRVRMQLCVCVV
jgi:hypothetical protein